MIQRDRSFKHFKETFTNTDATFNTKQQPVYAFLLLIRSGIRVGDAYLFESVMIRFDELREDFPLPKPHNLRTQVGKLFSHISDNTISNLMIPLNRRALMALANAVKPAVFYGVSVMCHVSSMDNSLFTGATLAMSTMLNWFTAIAGYLVHDASCLVMIIVYQSKSGVKLVRWFAGSLPAVNRRAFWSGARCLSRIDGAGLPEVWPIATCQPNESDAPCQARHTGASLYRLPTLQWDPHT
ncbi:protein of unknown function [Acidithiobacillus ferrivorans]|uniref:Uncharacterized protein n=1 Tax=Acidithiobacillus ferrivorans TaxID=160808 RepID=A0A060UQ75_9PROT|nr:hypothetical protein AFERRI_400351 [Acidithiobacillus ferrivorans]SMH64601.1 protein of unknown function [Acidithiobacillus ferrivorans]